MKEKSLSYPLIISIVIHLVVVAVVGHTYASRLTTAPSSEPVQRLIKVDFVREPDEQPKPTPRIVPVKPPTQEVAQRTEVVTPQPRINRPDVRVRTQANTSRPARQANTRPANVTHIDPPRSTGRTTPGNPGGALNMGTPSANGDLAVNLGSGRTGVGWVPGSNSGKGRGSGDGPGVGTPDPPKHADPGPGTRPAPAPPPPPPPPPPKMVRVKVCEASGMLSGRHCKSVDTRSFVDGTEPHSTCNKCKEPEPVHQSRLADRANPVLLRDSSVDTRALEEGLDTSVQVTYTVTADGDVTGVRVSKSSGDRAVDRAVVNAASKLKYKPAVQNGVPRSVNMTRTYKIRT